MDPMEKLIRLPLDFCYFVTDCLQLQTNDSQQCSVIADATNSLLDKYHWAHLYRDTRLENYPLVGDVFSGICVLSAYLLLATHGSKLMKDRKPLQLKGFIVFYNLAFSLMNLYFAVKTIYLANKLNYSYICMPVRFDPKQYETDKDSMELLWVFYLAFCSRIFEFLETLIYILRKKESQLTFLHVYHHATVFFFCWLILFLGPIGPSFQLAVWNCSVHFIMYLYYGLAALGPNFKKYLWWKMYLTRIQMMQFVWLIALVCINIHMDCYIEPWVKKAAVAYGISLFVLFGNFYYNAYKLKNDQKSAGLKLDSHDNIVGYAIAAENDDRQTTKLPEDSAEIPRAQELSRGDFLRLRKNKAEEKGSL